MTKFFLILSLFLLSNVLVSQVSFVFASCDQDGTYNSCNNSGTDWPSDCGAAYWDGTGWYNSGCNAIKDGACGSCFFKHCSSQSEAKLACSGGGSNSPPQCNITTNKASYNDGDYINFQVNAGDNGETFGGATGTPQLYYPVLSGSGCSSLQGFCPSINLCGNSTAAGLCSNVCTSTKATAVNSGGSSRNCTISAVVSNKSVSGTIQTGNCSVTVPVNPPLGGPNLTVTSFSFPPNNTGSPNSTMNAKIVVKNSGTIASGQFKVSVKSKSGGSMVCNTAYSKESGLIPSLSAGSSATVNLSMPTPVNPGTFTAGAMVDWGCAVTETNEADNIVTANYTTGLTPQVTCTNLTVTPSTSTTGFTPQFVITGSGSNGGTINQYKFDFGDGTSTTQASNTTTHVYPATVKNYTVNGYVTDTVNAITSGGTGACTQTVSVTGVGCTCAAWVNGVCGGGGCPANEKQQTRTCNPLNCQSQTQCSAPDPTCVSTSFFQTFGGSVTAVSSINDSNLIAGKFIAGDLTSPAQVGSAGVVHANSTTFGAGKISQNGNSGTNGWVVSPLPNTPDLNKVDYLNLMSSVLNYGGLSAASQVCGAPGDTKAVTVKGVNVTYKCYGGLVKDINLSAPSGSILVLIPASNDAWTISAGPTVGSKVIMFVDGSLTVNANITFPSPNPSTGLVVIGDTGSTVTFNSGTSNIDGMFVADAIDTGSSSTTWLGGHGMLIGRNSVTLGRQITGAAGETWIFEARYLDWFKGILSTQKIKWAQLPAQ